jgi:hypothetical protein
MEHRGLRRGALALLACLVCPITGHALTCPPGQREEAGRCVPIRVPHSYKKSAPGFNGKTVKPEGETIRPDTATRTPIDSETRLQKRPAVLPPAADTQKSGGPTGETTIKEAQSNRELVPVRAYLRSAEIPPKSIGAYGVVAFRARPTSASRSRLLMVCAAFVASIPTQKSVPGSVRISDEMLTIWPLDEPSSPEAAKDDCNFAIDHYDLYAGESAIADAGQNVKSDADGPFLIGWSPSNTRGVKDKVVLVIDMSPFDSQDSFDQLFRFWKQRIVEDPSLWRNGFSIEAVRLAVRDFADNYGDTILKAAVSVWKNKPDE